MTARAGLTERQKTAFDAITAFHEIKGYTPSVRELAADIGCAVSTAHSLIGQLQDRGYITKLHNRDRSIAITMHEASAADLLAPATRAALETYCRATGETAEDVINDAVMLFVDAREADRAEPSDRLARDIAASTMTVALPEVLA